MSQDFQKFLNQVGQKVNKLLKVDFPKIVKVEGLNFIHDNFDNEGFTESSGSVKKWKKRKKRKGKQGRKDKGRALMIKSGNLRRSWDNKTKASDNKVEFTSDKPYAERHNEGLDDMPQRQMIGDSRELDKRIQDKLKREMDKIFK